MYDGIVVPANVLLYQYQGTPSAVFSCQRTFFVDPMTYLFGQPFELFKRRTKKGDNYKPSFVKLFKGHGFDDVQLQFNYAELLRQLIRNPEQLKSFIRSAFEFQETFAESRLIERKDLLTGDDLERLEAGFRPKFLVAPYLMYSNNSLVSDDLLNINQAILTESASWSSNVTPIFGVIFVSRELLTSGSLEEIQSFANASGLTGFCLWADNFHERKASLEELKGYAKLAHSLSTGGKEVVILYGGFFSMLLHHIGVKTVCHGLGYGEHLSFAAAAKRGTGGPPVRYYIPRLHSFFMPEDALAILRKREDLLCDCRICQRIMDGDPENVTRFKDEEALAELHFLHCRAQEKQLIGNSSTENLIEYLEIASAICEDLKDVSRRVDTGTRTKEVTIVDPRYLSRWKDVLVEIRSTS